MIELTPLHLQAAGILILLTAGGAFVWWTVRALLGLHRGNPVYMLPDPDHDDPNGDWEPTDT